MPFKIVHVTRQFAPALGGIPKAIENLAICQIELGYKVNVIALDQLFQADCRKLPRRDRIGNIDVRRIPFVGSRRYALAPGVLFLIKGADIIHIHSSDFFLDYLSATKIIHGKTLILTSHGLYFHTSFAARLKRLYFRSITRQALRAVSAIICVSGLDYHALSKIVPQDKLSIIHNGVDVDALIDAPLANRDENLLLAVGTLAENKGYDRLLKCLAIYFQEYEHARLVITGPDKGNRAELEALARSLGIADRVRFAGAISDEALHALLRTARYWVSASRYEGFGIALLEAMAAGCMPIVQNLDPFVQILGLEGRLSITDFDDEDAVLRTFHTATRLTGKEKIRLAEINRKKAADYTWRNVAMQVGKLYADVSINDHGPA